MLRGQHVLIIEDEPLIALDLEQALSSAGAAVTIANSAATALEAIETLPKPRMAATKSYRSSPKIDCITNALACVFEAPLSSPNFRALQRAAVSDVTQIIAR